MMQLQSDQDQKVGQRRSLSALIAVIGLMVMIGSILFLSNGILP